MEKEPTLRDALNVIGMQLSEEFVGVSDGVELLSHLSAEERLSVLGTSAALDGNDLEQFARCVCGVVWCGVVSEINA